MYVDSERPIMSKNFPRQYPNNEYIKYHVQAPSAKVIKLEIKHLDVEGNMTGGCHDKLEVRGYSQIMTLKMIVKYN